MHGHESCSHDHDEPHHEFEVLESTDLPEVDTYERPGPFRRAYNWLGVLATGFHGYGEAAVNQAQMAVVCPCRACVGGGLGAALFAKAKLLGQRPNSQTEEL